jgi:hypothetical protein
LIPDDLKVLNQLFAHIRSYPDPPFFNDDNNPLTGWLEHSELPVWLLSFRVIMNGHNSRVIAARRVLTWKTWGDACAPGARRYDFNVTFAIQLDSLTRFHLPVSVGSRII